MKAEEIRDWDNTEIRARLGELREEKFRLRFRMGTMQLENPGCFGTFGVTLRA